MLTKQPRSSFLALNIDILTECAIKTVLGFNAVINARSIEYLQNAVPGSRRCSDALDLKGSNIKFVGFKGIRGIERYKIK